MAFDIAEVRPQGLRRGMFVLGMPSVHEPNRTVGMADTISLDLCSIVESILVAVPR